MLVFFFFVRHRVLDILRLQASHSLSGLCLHRICSSHALPWSPSWATWTTGRQPCWTPFASPALWSPSSEGSPSTSGPSPSLWTHSIQSRVSLSWTPPVTPRSPPCGNEAPTPPTSWSSLWPPMTAWCRRRRSRSVMPPTRMVGLRLEQFLQLVGEGVWYIWEGNKKFRNFEEDLEFSKFGLDHRNLFHINSSLKMDGEY